MVKAKKIPNTNYQAATKQTMQQQLLKKQKLETLKYQAKPAIEAKCKDLIDWAYEQITKPKEERELITIQSYLNERKISLGTWRCWVDKYPELKEARDNARAILSDMHLRLAASARANATPILRLSAIYNSEYKESLIVEADIKAKAQADHQINYVVGLPSFSYEEKLKLEDKE